MPAKTAAPTRSAPKAILIVEDHPLLRRGLTSLIEGEPDLAVCGEVSTCHAALQALGRSKPDLVIVDIGLEGCDGLDLIKHIKARHPRTPALVVSMHDESLYAERSLRAGARGYINKRHLDDSVLTAIRRVLSGELYMSEKMGTRLVERFIGGRAQNKEGSPLAALSDHELEIFRLIGQGRSTREIGRAHV